MSNPSAQNDGSQAATLPAFTGVEVKVLAAATLGTLAFKRGDLRVPAADPAVMELLEGNAVGDGIPVLGAWLAAWDAANLCKPASGPMILRSGRTAWFRREANGSQFCYAVPGHQELTPGEWAEVVAQLPMALAEDGKPARVLGKEVA